MMPARFFRLARTPACFPGFEPNRRDLPLLRICPQPALIWQRTWRNRGADHRQIASNLVKLDAIFGKVNLARPLLHGSSPAP
jgi:hypothetical protein